MWYFKYVCTRAFLQHSATGLGGIFKDNLIVIMMFQICLQLVCNHQRACFCAFYTLDLSTSVFVCG